MAALRGDVTPLISVPLVFEYEAVLKRRENLLRAHATAFEIDFLLDNLLQVAQLVDIAFSWRPSLNDPSDEMVLEAAVNGGADLLLTFNLRDFAGASRFDVIVDQPGTAWRRLMETR